MAEIIPFRRQSPRPPDCERALALLKEAHELLMNLVDSGQVEEGSPPEATLYYLDDAIGMLSPDDEEVAHG